MSNKYHTGLTPAAREVMKDLGRFRINDVIDGLGSKVQTYSDQNRVKKAVIECHRRGEIKRIERGMYQYVGKNKKPEIREKMWKVLRARRSVGIEDLQELAGAAESYALEWLKMLARNGIVRKLNNRRWQMIHDPVEMPKNEKKAQKLRDIRRRRKEAIEALDRASEAINVAKGVIEGIDDD